VASVSGSGGAREPPSSSAALADWTRVERGAESLAHLSATYATCHDLVRAADGIPALVRVLARAPPAAAAAAAARAAGGDATAAAAAAAALANLCNVNALNRDAVREAGGIQVRAPVSAERGVF